ncbi:MAG: DUF1963 domain-containing protein [Phycisphaerae bacterium]|nr:DUF1963 domain-containing protein [Phycisphaerae bacterium]
MTDYDPDAALREAGMVGPTILGILANSLGEEDKRIRRNAAKTLGHIGPAAEAAVPALICALRREAEIDREFKKTHRDADDYARIMFEYESARVNIRDALTRIGTPAVRALIAALSDDSRELRRDAARILLEAKPKSPEALAALVQASTNLDLQLRCLSVEALGEIGSASPEVISAFAKGLRDYDERVRREAVEAIGKLGPDAALALPALVEALEDEYCSVHGRAAVVLGRLGDIAKPAVPALLKLFGEDPDGHTEVADAVTRIDPRSRRVVTSLRRQREAWDAPIACKEDLLQRIQDLGLGRWATELEGLIRPSMRIRTRRVALKSLPLGASRIGGQPDLPSDWQWPTWNGRALDFLAQIRLADVASLDDEHLLPATGWLYIFYDVKKAEQLSEEEVGFNPSCWSVLHYAGDEHLLVRIRPPFKRKDCDADSTENYRRFGGYRPCALEFAPDWMTPPASSTLFALSLAEEEDNAYSELAERPLLYSETHMGKRRSGGHRLLGHPNPVQDAVELACEIQSRARGRQEWGELINICHKPEIIAAASRWRLLLQLDSDSNAEMIWGDVGALYFMMPHESLMKRAWDDAQLVLQCG